MKFPTVIEYLMNSGVLETGSKEEIAAAKKEHRKKYLLAKKREYRTTHKSITLSYPNAFLQVLQKEATAHKMKVPEYLRACIKAARMQAYIVPNTEKVQQIELLLRRIGTHTNQIARLTHQMSLPPTEALNALRGHMQKLEETLTKIFREPRNLETNIKEELGKNPSFMKILLQIIEHHMETLSHDN